MYYTRTQMAKLLGTTVETLRYYEDSGLIRACYDEASKRYQYRESDIPRLLSILLFRSMEVSIPDIRAFTENTSPGESPSMLDTQIESIRRRIKFLVETQDQLIAMRRRTRDVAVLLDAVEEIPRGDVYFMPISGETARRRPSVMQAWTQALPFAWPGVMVEPDALQAAQDVCTARLALNISREYASRYLPPKALEQALFKPAASTCKTVVVTEDPCRLPRAALDRLAAYAAERGTRLCGTITGVLLDHTEQQGACRYYIGLAADYAPCR